MCLMAALVASSLAESGDEEPTDEDGKEEPEGEPEGNGGLYAAEVSTLSFCFSIIIAAAQRCF